MQDDRGVKRILSVSRVYDLFQNLIGARRARRWLRESLWRLRGGEKVVDIGCGPGSIRNDLPENIDYVGFDLSEPYIATANRLYPGKGVFLVGTAGTFLETPDPRMQNADLVICTGLLHHLDDPEVRQVLELSKRILRPGGRLACLEPTFLLHQTQFSRWMLRRDRGKNVRTEAAWKAIVGEVFDHYTTSVITGLTRIPYVHIVIECRAESGAE
jgi:ubiquinone/menaquinone biosynthesis C-methylase UbiE